MRGALVGRLCRPVKLVIDAFRNFQIGSGDRLLRRARLPLHSLLEAGINRSESTTAVIATRPLPERSRLQLWIEEHSSNRRCPRVLHREDCAPNCQRSDLVSPGAFTL